MTITSGCASTTALKDSTEAEQFITEVGLKTGIEVPSVGGSDLDESSTA